MQLTLLNMVQNILNAMDSDPVNNIDDTVESLQVAEIIKECYYDIIAQRDWPFLRTFVNVSGLGDVNNPTKMLMPDNINKLIWVKYDKEDVTYLDPFEFKSMLDSRVEETGVVDANGYVLNRNPLYYTTYDDKYLFFDAVDKDVESTLVTAKCVAYGTSEPTWNANDTFVPTLPAKMFSTLLADAKSACFLNLKQQANAREERKAQRSRVIMQNEAWRTNDAEGKYNRKVNYGRR